MFSLMGSLIRKCALVVFIFGVSTTLREADHILTQDEKAQKCAFEKVKADQRAWKSTFEQKDPASLDVPSWAYNWYVDGNEAAKIGSGLKPGASILTVARELFLGKSNYIYHLAIAVLLILPILSQLFHGVKRVMGKEGAH